MTYPDDQLWQFRMAELACAIPYMQLGDSKGRRLLEIGAGTGHQAMELTRVGYEVEAIDLASSPYAQAQVFPVTTYDGVHLPFLDQSFDVVFSSNVLEHVEDLDALLHEVRRVLKRGGVSVHLMPTSTWRFWSLLSHFGWAAKRVVSVLTGNRTPRNPELGRVSAPPPTLRSAAASILPRRHGEHGSAVGELFSYRRRRWNREFARIGLEHLADVPTELFYTNSLVMGDKFSLAARRRIAAVAGSACRIYCFRLP